MMTLDIFRASVAAAALGFARRALDEGLARAKSRRMFGQTLGDLQLTQAALGDMDTAIDASALLTTATSRSTASSASPMGARAQIAEAQRSEEHTSELQSPDHLLCPLLLEKK